MKIESKQRQSGVGLVEILIALVLGLLLTIGMSQVLLGSKQAYRTQDALSRIQENGRYSMHVLGRDIRMAGFQGCGSLDIVEPNVIANNLPGSGNFRAEDAVRGYEFSSNTFTPLYGDTSSTSDDPASVNDNTDVITVSRADDCGAYLSGDMSTDNADIQLNPDNTCNFVAGDPILITDCANTDLFRATGVSLGSDITIAHANTQNTTNRLSKAYGNDARIFKYLQRDYFIRNNPFGEPALYMRENGGTPVELVADVDDMQILYGEDTSNDFFVNQNVQASGAVSWDKVSSVRLRLTLRSKTNNITLDNQRLSQDMTSTIGVRNRLP